MEVFVKGNWLGTIVAGVAIACLAIPLTVLGATGAELTQNSRQQALTTGTTASRAAVAADKQKERQERNALLAKKFALLKKRGTLVKQGNKDALDANSAQLNSVDASLINVKKGGTK